MSSSTSSSEDEIETKRKPKRIVGKLFDESSDDNIDFQDKLSEEKNAQNSTLTYYSSSSDDERESVEPEIVCQPEESSMIIDPSINNNVCYTEQSKNDNGTRSDEEPSASQESSAKLCDFDEMLKRKRAEKCIQRKRKSANNIDLINDNDDAISKLIADMRQASKIDKEFNFQRKPATNKMKLLTQVMKKLGKVDLIMAFVEANVLSVMTDWLAPMPFDKSLPHVKIRTEFLKFLENLRIDDYTRLKESGIGKAVMYLYRHPKEERENKKRAGRIVTKWARPIFKLTSDFSDLSREDRQERDEEMARKLGVDHRGSKSKKKEEVSTPSLRPGDPGWVMRARVPMPNVREYIRRPEWTSEIDISQDQKKKLTLLDKHKRLFADRRRRNRQQHAMKISLEGKNMDL
ncbi:protein IWS1 homolog [Lepeophtheirus salmonis]|uniref:protein IWS1 homolog n=1 Tax=Lepeophtheirus salmonis TaxID=72036 RepID=UPI001AE24169|nr:protein IWS1 homolog [Lepeophtheirus salmonis]